MTKKSAKSVRKGSNSPSSTATGTTWSPGSLPYPSDYNDHFETPLRAYEDIRFLLSTLRNSDGNSKALIIYDPYYCNGGASVRLRSFGYTVVHKKSDFYEDILLNKIPVHDALVTNPPYSSDHKEKCLRFCLDNWKTHYRPFFVLLPNYVACRAYYRSIVGEMMNDIVYFVPRQPYRYEHPEGTGKVDPPFFSIWFCCIGRDRIDRLKANGDKRLVFNLDHLSKVGAIPTNTRPNPRQRRKRKSQNMASPIPPKPFKVEKKTRPSNKKSQYRGKDGQRQKKRF